MTLPAAETREKKEGAGGTRPEEMATARLLAAAEVTAGKQKRGWQKAKPLRIGREGDLVDWVVYPKGRKCSRWSSEKKEREKEKGWGEEKKKKKKKGSFIFVVDFFLCPWELCRRETKKQSRGVNSGSSTIRVEPPLLLLLLLLLRRHLPTTTTCEMGLPCPRASYEMNQGQSKERWEIAARYAKVVSDCGGGGDAGASDASKSCGGRTNPATKMEPTSSCVGRRSNCAASAGGAATSGALLACAPPLPGWKGGWAWSDP
jgi:hypothetical protein